MKYVILILSVLFLTTEGKALNDTLPNFSVLKKNGIITISWHSTYKYAAQINIQRSKENNRNFVTIHSATNPLAKSYSHVDKTAKNDSSYYRIFILFEGVNYIFTAAQRPLEDTFELQKPALHPTLPATTGPVLPKEEITPPPSVPPRKQWEPSSFIFTGNDGNVVIQLPDANVKQYSIRFMNEEGQTLFNIPKIETSQLLLDKVNFLKSGWYFFELMENSKVIERNKFLITRDY
jgi:hypothetical protein